MKGRGNIQCDILFQTLISKNPTVKVGNLDKKVEIFRPRAQKSEGKLKVKMDEEYLFAQQIIVQNEAETELTPYICNLKTRSDY